MFVGSVQQYSTASNAVIVSYAFQKWHQYWVCPKPHLANTEDTNSAFCSPRAAGRADPAYQDALVSFSTALSFSDISSPAALAVIKSSRWVRKCNTRWYNQWGIHLDLREQHKRALMSNGLEYREWQQWTAKGFKLLKSEEMGVKDCLTQIFVWGKHPLLISALSNQLMDWLEETTYTMELSYWEWMKCYLPQYTQLLHVMLTLSGRFGSRILLRDLKRKKVGTHAILNELLTCQRREKQSQRAFHSHMPCAHLWLHLLLL